MEIIEKKKKEEERWSNDQLVLVGCLEFCEECDKQWQYYQDVLLQMHLFVKNYVPEEFIIKAKEEKNAEFDYFQPSSSSTPSSSSSTSPSASASASSTSPSSSSSSPSVLDRDSSSDCAFEAAYKIFERFRLKDIKKREKRKTEKAEEAEEEDDDDEEFEKNEKDEDESQEEEDGNCEEKTGKRKRKDVEKEKGTEKGTEKGKDKEESSHSSPSLQADETLMNLARFFVAMEEMEETTRQQKDIVLKTDGKYDPKLVGAAVKTIKYIWKRMGKFKANLDEFKKFK
eukprot:MONOS_13032.1-p1 / transcript=MONOS_13032.1 / gene=MONOS_13032 / organism=Monocercomonoides_exilis_PA203 / gene_product=unspecified product / transcript_product=unspecified product / location=Mono_scaffold00769:7786-8640(-) / protein_length=285 / sequence_SO=supercontig / SO=protein_coding / is_pseudo=false